MCGVGGGKSLAVVGEEESLRGVERENLGGVGG